MKKFKDYFAQPSEFEQELRQAIDKSEEEMFQEELDEELEGGVEEEEEPTSLNGEKVSVETRGEAKKRLAKEENANAVAAKEDGGKLSEPKRMKKEAESENGSLDKGAKSQKTTRASVTGEVGEPEFSYDGSELFEWLGLKISSETLKMLRESHSQMKQSGEDFGCFADYVSSVIGREKEATEKLNEMKDEIGKQEKRIKELEKELSEYEKMFNGLAEKLSDFKKR